MTIRILVIAATAVFAGIVTIEVPARAETAGAPLSLTPPALQAKRPPAVHRIKARKPIRMARRRGAPAKASETAAAASPAVATGDDSVEPIARLPWWLANAAEITSDK